MNYTEYQNQSNTKLLLLLAAVAVIALALAVGQLELSHHAAQGRENTNIDAAYIQSKIDKGGCKRVRTYVCDSISQVKVLCKFEADLWGGLIVGTASEPPIVVTGYVADWSYWQSSIVRDKCAQINK